MVCLLLHLKFNVIETWSFPMLPGLTPVKFLFDISLANNENIGKGKEKQECIINFFYNNNNIKCK